MGTCGPAALDCGDFDCGAHDLQQPNQRRVSLASSVPGERAESPSRETEADARLIQTQARRLPFSDIECAPVHEDYWVKGASTRREYCPYLTPCAVS
jgi:hypothetical protein